ncbi:hypothetical protein C8F04DRAFT_1175662 [Mycena alexandri]|uniref:F-box domain-containing protein n=1 Tax=Mycena alexandri TaxID=1745969 RepID=A0AAD6XCC4_9AGAR|nr:hypothetical protein C8F04DRAFT_1175662 [Mycena alexandri]
MLEASNQFAIQNTESIEVNSATLKILVASLHETEWSPYRSGRPYGSQAKPASVFSNWMTGCLILWFMATSSERYTARCVRSRCHSRISGSRTRNMDAEVAISAAQASPDRLRREDAELRCYSQQHKFLVTPIRSLPPELVAEIFSHSMGLEAPASRAHKYESYYGSERLGSGEGHYFVIPRIHKPPLIFMEICQQWRTIASSTPWLWNSISLMCNISLMPANLLLCETWLNRAGSLPLAFRFSTPGVVRPPTRELYHELLNIVMSYAHRWRWIDLDGLPAAAYQVLGGLRPASVPELEYLSINHHVVPSQAGPWSVFEVAPKLRDLYFDFIGATDIRVGVERPTFPFSQLTRLDVGDCSPDDALQILAQALAATFCVFHFIRDSPSLQTPFTHDHLQTLKVSSIVDMQAFWGTLTCSILSALSVELHNLASFGSQNLPRFIARCGTSIEDFTLGQPDFSDNEMITSLRHMPRLRNLDLTDSETFTNQVAKTLTLTSEESSPPLLPRLESLCLTGLLSCDDESLLGLLDSRISSPHGPPMKKLFLYVCRKMAEATVAKINAFKDLGVYVDISFFYDTDDEVEGETDFEPTSDESEEG